MSGLRVSAGLNFGVRFFHKCRYVKKGKIAVSLLFLL